LACAAAALTCWAFSEGTATSIHVVRWLVVVTWPVQPLPMWPQHQAFLSADHAAAQSA